METGQKIREYRSIKGLSQEYVAQQLGITQRAFSKIERGEVKVSTFMLEKIANVLDLDNKEFLLDNSIHLSKTDLCNKIHCLKRKVKELKKIIEDKNILILKMFNNKTQN